MIKKAPNRGRAPQTELDLAILGLNILLRVTAKKQKHLAQSLGVTPSYVCQILAGRQVNVPFSLIEKMARFFGHTVVSVISFGQNSADSATPTRRRLANTA